MPTKVSIISSPEVEKLKENWKDFRIDGAEVIFSVISQGLFSCPAVGWKAEIGGKKLGNYAVLESCDYNETAAVAVRQNFEETKKYVETHGQL